jgi:hypothetical protein
MLPANMFSTQRNYTQEARLQVGSRLSYDQLVWGGSFLLAIKFALPFVLYEEYYQYL